MSRQLPTTSLPGQVVFSSGHPGQPLAFTQLSSYGATYGGLGLVKTSRRTWQVLRRSGIPVPQSQAFAPGAQSSAAAYAQRVGFPAVVSSLSGVHRRTAYDVATFKGEFVAVAERVDDQVLVHSTVPGELLRFMVQGEQVLAVTGKGHRGAIEPEDLDPSLLQLAVDAVQAIPGLDTAAVTISTRRFTDTDVRRKALVERVMRSPHLRDYAGGSTRAALRLADKLVQATAQNLGVELPPPTSPVVVRLRFTGVPDPEAFTPPLSAMITDLRNTTPLQGLTTMTDGAELHLKSTAAQIGFIITRAILGFDDAAAYMVQTMPSARIG
ncbi:hypothetical protein D3250_09375 [Nesterenkonia natronophila]|uniref:Uncharacterized protein n=1 Tax=Nesterenkonia natronophila TaxID=2174932 RepID=A0A3A4EYZ2_9MICC|nr:hypothetical protein D3250_09375 [Nesterenkonia natronophila]